jgi:hypothetical protein
MVVAKTMFYIHSAMQIFAMNLNDQKSQSSFLLMLNEGPMA